MTEQLETTIVDVATRCLGPRISVDPNTSFDLLGLDSLASIELAAALEAELGCELPPDVLAGCTDAKSLAARLMCEGIGLRTLEDPVDRMIDDALLPDDVRPSRGVRANTDLRAARTILLTGATGFLGSAILRELLNTTSARILCLVRPASVSRLPVDPRVVPVEGDLEHARFGLSQSRFDTLIKEVDAVCHCAAAVNWVYSYASLRSANVIGTQELLRFACRAGAPFHFISSISTCYSTEGPRSADESFDALPHLRGVQLGYAQTKIVAEALVRTAGERGLPVRIYRPALISGNSVTGAFNRDDLISALVRGSVAMGTAPDLDWKLDCEPVDSVAASIVRLSAEAGPVFHLVHERPRHWRECVLWMRMYGYDVRLISYAAWLRQLDRETRPGSASADSHPLRPLRSFFLDRPTSGRGLTLPELYEETRRTQADGSSTRAARRACGLASPALDADILETYFSAFRAAGELPAPPRALEPRDREPLALDTNLLSEVVGRPVSKFELLSNGSDHSIVSELTAWRSKRTTGLFRGLLTTGASAQNVMVKVKARDRDVIAVGEALADLVDPAVGREYRRFSERIGFAASHAREIAIYQQRDPRFIRHAPAVLGTVANDETETWIAALEYVEDAVVADPEAARTWDRGDIEAAVDGLAALHSIWLGREQDLRVAPWIGYEQSTAGMVEMRPLWAALATHAEPSFSAWSDPDVTRIHRHLISTVDGWWQTLENGPRTLIHNDFNPRNICLRGADRRLCAFDWELATIGAPQRDLAELLTFALPPDVSREEMCELVTRHRAALERESGQPLDPETWEQGFSAGLCDFLINRLAIYTIVNRVRRQPFLPRVLRTWRALYQLFPQ